MKIKITNGMLLAVVINVIYAKAIGVTQGIVARQAGGDMWLVTLLSTMISIVVILLVVFIIKRSPKENIFQQTGTLIGEMGEFFLGIIIFLFFLGAFGGVMITIVYHLMDYFLPDAPPIIFVVVAMVVGIIGLFYGVEVIARISILGLFSIALLNILILLGSLSYFEMRHLLPLFRNGFLNSLEVTRHVNADYAMGILFVAIYLPLVKDEKKWYWYSGKSILYGGFLIIMWPILQVGVLSPEVAGQYIVSCMQIARSAEIGLFIHRYELIMIVFFSLSALIQVMVCLLCGSISLKHVLGVKNLNVLFLPVSLLFGGFGYWIVRDHIWAMDYLTYYWPNIANPVMFGVPLLLLLLGFIFKKKLKNATQNKKEKETNS